MQQQQQQQQQQSRLSLCYFVWHEEKVCPPTPATPGYWRRTIASAQAGKHTS